MRVQVPCQCDVYPDRPDDRDEAADAVITGG